MDLREALANSGALRRQSGVRTDDSYAFGGGLNLTDPPLKIAPGQVLGVKNYEPGIRGGYARADGVERFDGRTSPTDGSFTLVSYAGNDPAVGDTIREYAFTTTTLQATGTVAYVYNAGEYATGTRYAVVVNITGTFLGGGSSLYYNATAPGPFDANSYDIYIDDAPDDTLFEDALAQKTAYLRTLIGKVGGASCSGPVRGVRVFGSTIYAFRDNAGATAGTLWKSSSTGWTAVDLGYKVYFSTGVIEITEGVTITGATSGATAVVKRVSSSDGTWGKDASGFFVTDAITGAFTVGENLQVAGVTRAKFVSSAAQTLPAGGSYRFRAHNFYGADDRYRLYGVNGVGNGFEFDGTVFVLIETGMTSDIPHELAVHNDHLLFVFAGGSVQNSGFQKPLDWNPITGADERSVGGTVTFINEEADRTTLICTRYTKSMFYGDVVENFQLRTLTPDAGALPNTGARIGQTILLDDQGYVTLKTSQAFGNFQASSISDLIQTQLVQLLQAQYPVCVQIIRRKNLYRCYFSSGTILTTSFTRGNGFTGWLTSDYGITVSCASSDEYVSGSTLYTERSFIGTSDGYVMETDKGRSFDGAAIEAFVRMPYNNSRSPSRYKRYRRAVTEIQLTGPCELTTSVDFNYGAVQGQLDDPVSYTGGGGYWDVSQWNRFKWSQAAFSQIFMKIEGEGFNIGFVFYSNSAVDASHTLHSISLHESVRRINRGTQT